MATYFTIEERLSKKLGYKRFFSDCNEFHTRKELDERFAQLAEQYGSERVKGGAMLCEDTMYIAIICD